MDFEIWIGDVETWKNTRQGVLLLDKTEQRIHNVWKVFEFFSVRSSFLVNFIAFNTFSVLKQSPFQIRDDTTNRWYKNNI